VSENTRQQQAEEAEEKKKMNNKRTLRGRFEFMKDLKPLYKMLAGTGPWCPVELLGVTRDEQFYEPEVTFDFFFADDKGSEEDQVNTFLRELDDTAAAMTWEEGAIKGTPPGSPCGIELHVFTQSLKWLEDYDGKRDGPWSCVGEDEDEMRESA
jgi:hypothetical protein